MMDQYFGHKELYEVVLRAQNEMHFGTRRIEADEPVLYFNNVNMSVLGEQNRPVFAQGGWGNMPHVIWDERSEVQFQMTEGVMSSVGMSILLSANVTTAGNDNPIYVNMREGPMNLIPTDNGLVLEISREPVLYPEKKVFIFRYARNTIQEKVFGTYLGVSNDELGIPHYRIALNNENFTEFEKNNNKYVVDYYYKYKEEDALIYTVAKERFNGLFTLEAKIYSKDENEGKNYTNILYMPKVRIVSNINLRLGERADPTVSTFNIIGLPETVGNDNNVILKIQRLNEDLSAEI